MDRERECALVKLKRSSSSGRLRAPREMVDAVRELLNVDTDTLCISIDFKFMPLDAIRDLLHPFNNVTAWLMNHSWEWGSGGFRLILRKDIPDLRALIDAERHRLDQNKEVWASRISRHVDKVNHEIRSFKPEFSCPSLSEIYDVFEFGELEVEDVPSGWEHDPRTW